MSYGDRRLMANTRLETLKGLLDQNPNDAFARYGLATEYLNTGEWDQAIGEFEALISVNPEYAAAYYHGGRTLEKLGRRDDARMMYERGIEVTGKTGDAHTQSELQTALQLLE